MLQLGKQLARRRHKRHNTMTHKVREVLATYKLGSVILTRLQTGHKE